MPVRGEKDAKGVRTDLARNPGVGRNATVSVPQIPVPTSVRSAHSLPHLAAATQSAIEAVVRSVNSVLAERLPNIDSRGRFVGGPYFDRSGRPVEAGTADAITGQGALATLDTVTNTEIDAAAAIDPSKILISGSVYLDDWRNPSDNTKIRGALLAAGSITAASVADNAVTGVQFDELVVDEFQTMGSALSDAQWDALAT